MRLACFHFSALFRNESRSLVVLGVKGCKDLKGILESRSRCTVPGHTPKLPQAKLEQGVLMESELHQKDWGPHWSNDGFRRDTSKVS